MIHAPTVRAERDSDAAAIRTVLTAAFGSPAEADLVERIRASDASVPELALVAELDGRIVGHVMVSRATLRRVDGDHAIALLAPLAVDPAVQRAGIGTALVRAVAAAAEELGEPCLVLEGSPAYYGRLGFLPAASFGITMPLPDWAPPDAAQLLPLAGFDPDDPRHSGHVVYPPEFDDLA